MDTNTLAIYIHELRNQCLHIQTAYDLFNQAARNRAGSGILYGGQLVLSSASQLSSILWPSRARARGRGDSLRSVLKLTEKHPLNDRRLSELWERSDEKLEEWIARTKGKQVAFDFVGDPTQLGDGVGDDCIFRGYNPNTRIFYLRGVAYNLQALADAISDVGGRVHAVYKQLFPEQAAREAEAAARAAEAQKAAQEQAAQQQAAQQQAAQGPAVQQQPAQTTGQADAGADVAKTAAAQEAPVPIDLTDGSENGGAQNDGAGETPAKKTRTASRKAPAKKTAAAKAPAKKPAAKKPAVRKTAAGKKPATAKADSPKAES